MCKLIDFVSDTPQILGSAFELLNVKGFGFDRTFLSIPVQRKYSTAFFPAPVTFSISSACSCKVNPTAIRFCRFRFWLLLINSSSLFFLAFLAPCSGIEQAHNSGGHGGFSPLSSLEREHAQNSRLFLSSQNQLKQFQKKDSLDAIGTVSNRQTGI